MNINMSNNQQSGLNGKHGESIANRLTQPKKEYQTTGQAQRNTNNEGK